MRLLYKNGAMCDVYMMKTGMGVWKVDVLMIGLWKTFSQTTQNATLADVFEECKSGNYSNEEYVKDAIYAIVSEELEKHAAYQYINLLDNPNKVYHKMQEGCSLFKSYVFFTEDDDCLVQDIWIASFSYDNYGHFSRYRFPAGPPLTPYFIWDSWEFYKR